MQKGGPKKKKSDVYVHEEQPHVVQFVGPSVCRSVLNNACSEQAWEAITVNHSMGISANACYKMVPGMANYKWGTTGDKLV